MKLLILRDELHIYSDFGNIYSGYLIDQLIRCVNKEFPFNQNADAVYTIIMICIIDFVLNP